MKRIKAEAVLKSTVSLAEGPMWLSSTGELSWVEPFDGNLHIFNPESREDRVIDVGPYVGSAAPDISGGFVFATRQGFARLTSSGEIESLAGLVEQGVRLNDGKCAPDGAFWAGTIGENREPLAGSLYRLSPTGSITIQLTGVTVSNGMAWEPDGKRFYYIDSPTRRIDSFDVDSTTQELSNRRTFIEVQEGWGNPDGMAIDDEGCLWVALWGGGKVVRYTPEGVPDTVVELPVKYVTSCCFGGSDGKDLYITSAPAGFSPSGPRERLNGEILFHCRSSATGSPPVRYAYGRSSV